MMRKTRRMIRTVAIAAKGYRRRMDGMKVGKA
jgi:hypothetical protein